MLVMTCGFKSRHSHQAMSRLHFMCSLLVVYKHGAAPVGQLPPRDLYDCCPPSWFAFAFDGLSAAATHATPPVPSSRSSSVGVTALFTLTSRRDTRSAALLSSVIAEVLTAEGLLLTTEEFN